MSVIERDPKTGAIPKEAHPEPARCPWCGRHTYVAYWALDSDYSVECPTLHCAASGPLRTTPERAVNDWNAVVNPPTPGSECSDKPAGER